jgi:hypothetical protein
MLPATVVLLPDAAPTSRLGRAEKRAPTSLGATGTLGAQGGVGERLPYAVGVTGREAAARGAEPLWGGLRPTGTPKECP